MSHYKLIVLSMINKQLSFFAKKNFLRNPLVARLFGAGSKNPQEVLKEYSEYLEKHRTSHWNVLNPVDHQKIEKLNFFDGQNSDRLTLNKSISEPTWSMLNRKGKRIRPIFMLLIADTLNLEKSKILDFGLTVETIHNGTLIIDDIEDKSLTRRGEPCVHLQYEIDTSINAGNYLYFGPLYHLMGTPSFTELEKEIQLEILGLYIEEMRNIHFGLGWDITWHKDYSRIPEENHYMQMVQSKTSVLFKIGMRWLNHVYGLNDQKFSQAILENEPARASTLGDGFKEKGVELGSNLINFSNNVGIAFQIVDDLLNVSSEEYAIGKGGIGEDITEGKLTLMALHHIRESADSGDRLIEILKMHTPDKDFIAEAIGLMKATKSLEYGQEVSQEYISRAISDLELFYAQAKLAGFEIQQQKVDDLLSVVDFVVNRSN